MLDLSDPTALKPNVCRQAASIEEQNARVRWQEFKTEQSEL